MTAASCLPIIKGGAEKSGSSPSLAAGQVNMGEHRGSGMMRDTEPRLFWQWEAPILEMSPPRSHGSSLTRPHSARCETGDDPRLWGKHTGDNGAEARPRS